MSTPKMDNPHQIFALDCRSESPGTGNLDYLGRQWGIPCSQESKTSEVSIENKHQKFKFEMSKKFFKKFTFVDLCF